ncbi:MAG: 1-acyl-sn-glycerol-3-phosphate acyltransferase [Chloroflexi bacterium]|nr:1-acyl-sn-glycerol-3-phosphate acyltransferase [Chloroflexota bacterium]
MQTPPSLPPKPVSEILRPELTRMPEYSLGRKFARRALWHLQRIIVGTRLKVTARGLENFPARGPALIVINHLGDADVVVILSRLLSQEIDPLAASNLYDIPALRFFAEAYGVIWLHRGRPDRKALNCAFDSLKLGRFVMIAPEGRESVAGGLEQGLDGASFLALRADVPLVPIAVTGTENDRVWPALKRWPRLPVGMTVGRPFRLDKIGDRHADLKNGTDRIMRELANLLPEEYQGAYRHSNLI